MCVVGEGGGVNRVYGKKKVARKDRRIYKNSKEKSQKKWTREKKRGRAGRERERERERELSTNARQTHLRRARGNASDGVKWWGVGQRKHFVKKTESWQQARW